MPYHPGQSSPTVKRLYSTLLRYTFFACSLVLATLGFTFTTGCIVVECFFTQAVNQHVNLMLLCCWKQHKASVQKGAASNVAVGCGM